MKITNVFKTFKKLFEDKITQDNNAKTKNKKKTTLQKRHEMDYEDYREPIVQHS